MWSHLKRYWECYCGMAIFISFYLFLLGFPATDKYEEEFKAIENHDDYMILFEYEDVKAIYDPESKRFGVTIDCSFNVEHSTVAE